MRNILLVFVLSAFMFQPVQGQNPDYTLSFGAGFGVIGGTAQVDTLLSISAGAQPISGWSLGVCHSDMSIEIIEVTDGLTTAGLDPDFSDQSVIAGQGWTAGVLLSFVGLTTLGEGDGYSLHTATYQVMGQGDPVLSYCSSLGSPAVDTLMAFPDSSTATPIQESGSITISDTPPFTLEVGPSAVAPGGLGQVGINLTNPLPVQAISFGLSFGTDRLLPVSVEPGEVVQQAAGPEGPDFLAVDLSPGSSTGITFLCVLSLTAPYVEIPIGAGEQLAVVEYECSADAQLGEVISATLVDNLGEPPVLLRATVEGVDAPLVTQNGSVLVDGSSQAPSFIRGDVDANQDLALGDPIQLISYMFTSGQEPSCLATADFDDDGLLQLNDIVNLLGFLFNDGPAPSSPFNSCGQDTTEDSLGCVEYPCP